MIVLSRDVMSVAVHCLGSADDGVNTRDTD
jgi:hypothetical protein